MNREELWGVAEIIGKLTERYNGQLADHERQLTEHRAAFGARTEADAKIIAGLREESAKYKAERDHFYQREGIEQKRRMDAESERDGLLTQVQDMRAEEMELQGHLREMAVILGKSLDERDALRAEVDFLKTLRPKYKVGDKLESYNKSLGLAIPVTVRGVRIVYDCSVDDAKYEEYTVGHAESELSVPAASHPVKRSHPVKVGEWVRRTKKCAHFGHVAKVLAFIEPFSYEVQCIEGRGIWYFHNCEPCDPPEATHAEPDLTHLHAKGKEAWSDVPNATQWVEEMRGNTEATHDTVQGKVAAESAVRNEPVAEPIKVGDVAKVVGASGDLTAQSDIGKIGEVLKIDFGDGTVLLSGGAGWVNRCDVRKVTT